MKYLLLILCLGSVSEASELWKGHTETAPIEIGVMAGMSIYGTQTGWGVLPNVSYLIVPQGFAEDVDDRVWLEMEAGPAFFTVGGNTVIPFQYSLHMRWDFTMNQFWTFYGLGGLSGYSLPPLMGNAFHIHPRFGAGVEYQTKTPLMFRAELSAEFMGAGIALNF